MHTENASVMAYRTLIIYKVGTIKFIILNIIKILAMKAISIAHL